MSTFRRNAIIAGYINSYCLVCECFFETEELTFNHTNDEDHEKKLLAYPYLEKYGNNGIRKVKAGYFCGYCNILMATAAKVNLHIAEKMHYHNKGDTLLKQCGSYITAFDEVLISETAWHCIADDACAMCNTEFDDGNEHMTERAHLIKLMQNKVEFGNNNNLYRRIDKNDFQCLTCNSVLSLSNLDEHFNEEAHKQKYIQCQEEKKKYDLANPKVTVKPKNETKNFETAKNSDMKKILIVDKEIYNMNTVAGAVNTEISLIKKENVCTISNIDTKIDNIASIAGNKVTTKDVKGVNQTNETKFKDTKAKPQENPPAKRTQLSKENENKRQETKLETTAKNTNKREIVKPKVDSTDPATYAEDNKITYNPRKPNAICKTCLKSFPSNFKALKEHVNGRYHINKCKPKPTPKKPPKKDNLTRQSILDFVTKIQDYNNGTDCDIVINETILLTEKSCHGITGTAKFEKFICQMCGVDLSEGEVREHCKTITHERAMRCALVVTSWKNEFIREVRPGMFQCGSCNVVLRASREVWHRHLQSLEHGAALADCKRKLQRLPCTYQSITHPVKHDCFFFNHITL